MVQIPWSKNTALETPAGSIHARITFHDTFTMQDTDVCLAKEEEEEEQGVCGEGSLEYRLLTPDSFKECGQSY